MKRAQKPGPKCPRWLSQSLAHTGQGGYETPRWAIAFHAAVSRGQVGRKSKPLPMPDTKILAPTRYVWEHGTYVEKPGRVRQVAQGWDAVAGRWVTLTSPADIRRILRQSEGAP